MWHRMLWSWLRWVESLLLVMIVKPFFLPIFHIFVVFIMQDGLERRGFKETGFLNEVAEVVRTGNTFPLSIITCIVVFSLRLQSSHDIWFVLTLVIFKLKWIDVADHTIGVDLSIITFLLSVKIGYLVQYKIDV